LSFSPQTTGTLLVFALVLAGALVLAVALLGLRLRQLRRSYSGTFDPARGRDLVDVLDRLFAGQDQIRADMGVVHKNTEHLRDLHRTAVSRVGIVRFDAFDDMGGQLSFSAALLDEQGDGVVITAINGRTEARSYAKPIAGGQSSHNLSDEEEAAIRAAVTGVKGKVTTVPKRWRRNRVAS